MSMSLGGYRPGSGPKKGSTPWNKGIPMSEESKAKVSQSKKGSIAWNKGIEMPSVSEKMKGNKNGEGNKGRIMSSVWIGKLSKAKLGKVSPRKGAILTKEQKLRIGLALKGRTYTEEEIEKNRQGQYRRFKRINPNYTVNTRSKRIAENGGFHTKKEWNELKEKCGFTCLRCRKVEPEIKLTRDHIVPVLLGGKNDIKNIQPLCQSCNSLKYLQSIKY